MFEDLRPYVCTFESCHRLNYLFASRHEWFDHEETYHRREWYCKQCDIVSPSHPEFELHLQQHHPDLSGSADACARPILGLQQCPLCSATCASPRLRRHLGRHMQRLALLALRSHQHDNADSRDHHDSKYTTDLEFRTNPSSSGEAQKLIADESPPEPRGVTPDQPQTQPPQPKPAVDNSEKAAADISSPPGQEYGRTAMEAVVERFLHVDVKMVQKREVLEDLGEWSVGRTSYISLTDF